jgi:hypothetical protein
MVVLTDFIKFTMLVIADTFTFSKEKKKEANAVSPNKKLNDFFP